MWIHWGIKLLRYSKVIIRYCTNEWSIELHNKFPETYFQSLDSRRINFNIICFIFFILRLWILRNQQEPRYVLLLYYIPTSKFISTPSVFQVSFSITCSLILGQILCMRETNNMLWATNYAICRVFELLTSSLVLLFDLVDS